MAVEGAMKGLRTVSYLFLLSVAGCSSVPDFPDEGPGAIGRLARQIDCELAASVAARKNQSLIDPNKWVVTYSITDKARESASLSLNALKWIVPANIETLVVGGSLDAGRGSERTGVAEYSANLGKLRTTECADVKGSIIVPEDFKFGQWYDQIVDGGRKPTSFGYTVEVEIAAAVGVRADIADGRFGVSPGLGGRKSATRTVAFAFTENIDAPPQEVFVVNFPSSGVVGRSSSRRKPIVQSVPFEAIQQNRLILDQLRDERRQ